MTFEEVIDILSKEKLTVKFTPNFYTGKRKGVPYGYYEIEKSPLGGVMIEVDYIDEQEDNPTDMILIRGQNLDEDLYKFADEISPIKRLVRRHKETSFEQGKRFIKSLPTIKSGLTEKEAFLRSFHFKDSEEDKQAFNKHYLNARVIYDTMHEIMGAKCKVFPVNGGYVIESVFDNGDAETIHIKQTQEYNSRHVPYAVMHITIPSVDLRDKFDDHTDSAEMMIFNKAKIFMNMAANPWHRYIIAKPEDFTRWDKAYLDMMAEIKKHRGKVK